MGAGTGLLYNGQWAAAFIAPESIRVFEKHHVYSETELRARYEIKLEKYTKIVGIEANTMLQMVNRQIMPACLRFADETARAIVNIKAAGCDILPAEETLRQLTKGISQLAKATKKLEHAVDKSEKYSGDYIMQANFARDYLVTAMDEIRKYADELEMIVDKNFWPMPTYDDLIYSV